MNPEEAALLPARSGRIDLGGAALQAALQRARAMADMHLSNAVPTDESVPAAAPEITLSAVSERNHRAALHHVLRK